jgi:8-oxo-dGTP diphosphatase
MQKVVCAIIVDQGKVLVCQRGPGQKMEGQWEFPGGKVDPGESPADAILREIREELTLELELERQSPWFPHTYPWGEMALQAFVSSIVGGSLTLLEHSNCQWVGPEALNACNWCAADLPVVAWYISTLEQPGP